jgi:hypothetical protein
MPTNPPLTFLRFLFEGPERFWIAPKKRLVLQPAE